jgi:hypothetical protein
MREESPDSAGRWWPLTAAPSDRGKVPQKGNGLAALPRGVGEKVSRSPAASVTTPRGKPHQEQDRQEGCVARAPSGKSHESNGNARPRGMTAGLLLTGGDRIRLIDLLRPTPCLQSEAGCDSVAARLRLAIAGAVLRERHTTTPWCASPASTWRARLRALHLLEPSQHGYAAQALYRGTRVRQRFTPAPRPSQ